jgi:hypothetical protein
MRTQERIKLKNKCIAFTTGYSGRGSNLCPSGRAEPPELTDPLHETLKKGAFYSP